MANAGLRSDEYAIYSAVFKVGPLTISELAPIVGMPLTTVSDYVQTMTSRGHARRWGNPTDSRSFLVALTDEGPSRPRRRPGQLRQGDQPSTTGTAPPGAGVIRALHALDDAVGQVLAELAAENRRQRQPAAAVRVRTRPGKAVHE